MRKLLFAAVIIVILSIFVWQGFMQEPKEEVEKEKIRELVPKGSLPTWMVGDSWTYISFPENVTFTLTVDNVDHRLTVDEMDYLCYRLIGVIDPPLNGWSSHIRLSYEKSTLMIIEKTVWNVDRAETTYFRRTHLDNLWPLAENVSITQEVQIERFGVRGVEGWSDPSISTSYVIAVEAVENTAVLAGTFECYLISTRTLEGSLVEERWYSDTVKNFVKIVDYQAGETLELSAYELR